MRDGVTFTTFIGEFQGSTSPALVYSDLVGVEISAPEATLIEIPLHPEFEYGILVDDGSLEINGSEVLPGGLRYIPEGASTLSLHGRSGFRVILLGGRPYEEEIVMWWNFIASTHEEIVQARTDWESQSSSRFPAFMDGINQRIPAPEMPNLHLAPRPRHRR